MGTFRAIIFTMLVSTVFVPTILITEHLLKTQFSMRRRLMGAALMGLAFTAAAVVVENETLKVLVRLMSYFAVFSWLFSWKLSKSVFAMLIYMAVTGVTEYGILYMLDKTIIGFEQLLMIDAFYAMILAFNTALLSALYLLIRHLPTRRFSGKATVHEQGESRI